MLPNGTEYTFVLGSKDFSISTVYPVIYRIKDSQQLYSLKEIKEVILPGSRNNLIIQNYSFDNLSTFISGIGLNKEMIKEFNIKPRKALVVHMCSIPSIVKFDLDYSLYWGIYETRRPKKFKHNHNVSK